MHIGNSHLYFQSDNPGGSFLVSLPPSSRTVDGVWCDDEVPTCDLSVTTPPFKTEQHWFWCMFWYRQTNVLPLYFALMVSYPLKWTFYHYVYWKKELITKERDAKHDFRHETTEHIPDAVVIDISRVKNKLSN